MPSEIDVVRVIVVCVEASPIDLLAALLCVVFDDSAMLLPEAELRCVGP